MTVALGVAHTVVLAGMRAIDHEPEGRQILVVTPRARGQMAQANERRAGFSNGLL